MRGRRKFYEGVVNHVYQRTVDWVNIFYCHEDFLVFYTIFAVCVKSSNVSVLELCLMYDHIHFLIQTETMMELSAFVDRFTAWFVHEYNNSIGRSGKLFHKNFGSAPKSKEKAVRTAINYVGNNPVEKGLHGKAVNIDGTSWLILCRKTLFQRNIQQVRRLKSLEMPERRLRQWLN